MPDPSGTPDPSATDGTTDPGTGGGTSDPTGYQGMTPVKVDITAVGMSVQSVVAWILGLLVVLPLVGTLLMPVIRRLIAKVPPLWLQRETEEDLITIFEESPTRASRKVRAKRFGRKV
ncbi:MAG: hypothetical protein WCO64_02380 [Actinomycetes bacterium]